MSKLLDCQQDLLTIAGRKGYLTFDDILDAASTFLLSASEIDRLSDNIQSLGILLYESAPMQLADKSENFSDYSRTDYEAIFSEIIAISESISPLVDIAREIPPIQFGEVQTLVEQLQYGNKYARERLVLSHLKVALKIALSITKQYSYDIEDAISAGFIGLMEAVNHFDPNGFSAFQPYASMWVQQCIHRFCNPVWMQYYCPFHIKEKMYPILLRFNRNNGTQVTDNWFDPEAVLAIAEETEYTPEQVERCLRFAYNQMFGKVELDAIGLTQFELQQSAAGNLAIDDLHDKVARSELRLAMENLLKVLKPREQEIIRLRFGFDGAPPRTLEEVSQIFGITRARVSQIESNCIRRLRHPTNARKIKDFH